MGIDWERAERQAYRDADARGSIVLYPRKLARKAGVERPDRSTSIRALLKLTDMVAHPWDGYAVTREEDANRFLIRIEVAQDDKDIDIGTADRAQIGVGVGEGA